MHSPGLQEIVVRNTINVIDTNRLLGERGLVRDRHRSTAIRRLWGHGVRSDHDTDCANIEQDEAEPPDDLDDDQRNFSLWPPLHIAIIVELGLLSLAFHDKRADWDQEDHQELDENGPGGHVHAVLGPALRRALAVRKLQGAHASTNEEDRKHRAECNGALCVLHSVRDEMPFPARQLFHRDANPDEDVDNEELRGKIDHTLHRHRNRRCVLLALGVLNGEDRPDHGGDAKIHGDHDEPTEHQQACSQHFVFHLVLNVTLTLVTLLDAASKHQWNTDCKNALKHHCIGACIEAIL